MPTRLIASSFALIAFAAAIISGLKADNPAATTLWRALVAMAFSYPLGWVIGAIGQRAVQEHIEQYKQAHPLGMQEAGEEPGSHGGQEEGVDRREGTADAA